MVKVDDLNASIEAFGSIVKRFDEIQEACKQMDDVLKKEEENNSEIKKACEQQRESLDAQRRLEVSVERKIDSIGSTVERKVETAESSLKDKMELVKYEFLTKTATGLQAASEEVKSQLQQESATGQKKLEESTQRLINSLKEEQLILKSELYEMKKLQIITIASIIVVAIMQLIGFYF